MTQSAATADNVVALPAGAGSRILTAWKADRERERRHQAASREQAAALADFRRHSRPLSRGRLPSEPTDQARAAFAAVSGQRAFGEPEQRAFAAGGTDRLSMGWTSINTGINADLEAALATLRARSRDWCMNTDLGARYLELCADNIVGAESPRLQVRAKLSDGTTMDEAANTAIEQAWALWGRQGCEVTGRLSFGEVCRQNVQATARDGEYLARRIRDKRLPFGYQLQLLDVDRIDSSLNVSSAQPGGPAIRMGIETDARGRLLAVHLLHAHPGDPGGAYSQLRERVPADQILHGFVTKRAEQLRGYPWTAAVLKRSNTLHSFEGHALTAAKYGAAKMGFYTIDKDAPSSQVSWDDLKDATGELVQDIEEGLLEALPPGVGFQSFDPKYPEQNFGPFVTEFKQDIAAGLNVAHHNLTGKMTGVNYSSARIAELSERRSWRALQKWLINGFVRVVFEDWLRMALLTQSIRLPSGAPLPADRFEKFAQAASFQPPGWAWVDPEGDLKANAMAATYDMRSLRQITDEMGVDLEDNLADKARLRDRYVALGLPVPPWLSGGTAVMAAGVPTPAPAPKPEGATSPDGAAA